MVDSTYQIFVDIDATALEGGYVWVGAEYDNPEVRPIPIFWDAEHTIAALQPLRTSGGYIVRDGTPANVYTAASTYSIVVNNIRQQRVFYTAIAGGELPASRITFPIPSGPTGDTGATGDKGDTGGNVLAIGLFTEARATPIVVADGTNLVQTSGHTDLGIGIALYAYDAGINDAYLTSHPLSSFKAADGRRFRLAEDTGDLTFFGGSPTLGTRNSDALDEAYLLYSTVRIPLLPGLSPTWTFTRNWPVIAMAPLNIRFDVEQGVTISQLNDVIQTPFGLQLQYVRETKHAFRALGNVTFTSRPDTNVDTRRPVALLQAEPDNSRYIASTCNGNQFSAMKILWPGSDTWAADTSQTATASNYTIAPAAADQNWHVRLTKMRPGKELIARPFLGSNGGAANIPQFIGLIRHSGGYVAIKGDLNQPPTVSICRKDIGSVGTETSLGFGSLPGGTHASYWPINARWSLRQDSWNSFSVYFENFQVARIDGLGTIYDGGFGIYPNTATDVAGWDSLVEGRNLPPRAGLLHSAAFFGHSRVAPRDGSWPEIGCRILDATAGVRVIRCDNLAVAGTGSTQIRAAMTAANLAQYNSVYIEPFTNDIQGGEDYGVATANLVAMIDMVQAVGAICVVGVDDLWITQGQAGAGIGQAATRYAEGGPLRMAIMRLCAEKGAYIIDLTRHAGPVLGNAINPALTPYFGALSPIRFFDIIHPGDVRNQITAVSWARKMVAILCPDPTWAYEPTEVVYKTGWQSGAQQPKFSVSKAGTVNLRGPIQTVSGTATGTVTVATVPAAFRPDVTVYFTSSDDAGNARLGAIDAVTGDISVYGLTTATTVTLNASYPLAGT